MTGSDPIDDINHRAMLSAKAVTEYSWQDQLSPPERVLVDRLSAEMKDQPILDMGVGGGRTTAHLLAVSKDYTGIDYSDGMLGTCQRKHPGVKFLLMDARDMAAFPTGSFALALFSCNGIGMVSHADRLKILAEVHRVLRPGGAFLVSSHNTNCPDHDAGLALPEFPTVSMTKPVRAAKALLRYALDSGLRVRNYRRLSKQEIRVPDYSIINDRSQDYGVMLHYISLRKQREQLASVGFAPNAEAYDLHGNQIRDGADTSDSSIMYLARKF